jgi:hypothetical protein
MILLLTRDLFFSSKITGTGQLLGLTIKACGGLELFGQWLADPADPVAAVILDLGSGMAPADVAAAIPSGQTVKMLAFGSHVDVAAMNAAREAGFEPVLPRSRFTAELPQLLQSLSN